MNRDVDDMEKMLDAFLAFARADQGEEAVEVDLPVMARDLVAQAARGGLSIDLQIEKDGDVKETVFLREASICRAVLNLINNAGKYGTRVRLTLRIQPRTVMFVVEDDGPGVPEDKREEVTRPFTRLDSARNQDKGGGVGLGLAIALDTARAHGGALELAESADLGGLKCVLRIPR